MKQNFTLNLKVFLIACMAMLIGGGSAVAQTTETIDLTAQGYANAAEVTTVEGTNVTLTFDKGSNSNAPKYYNSGTAVRVYGGNSMTVTSKELAITNISITFGGSDGKNELTTDVGTLDGGEWTGNSNAVVFTVGGTSGNRRFKSVEVTFADGGGTVVILEKPAMAVTGKVYADEYIREDISVALSAEAGDIYYTTGSDDFSTEAWTKYNNAITIDQTTTLRAVAYNGTETSAETKATYTYLDVLDGVRGLREDFVANEVRFVNLTDAVITGSYGKYGYVEDAKAGMALYNVSGIQAGVKLNGIVLVKTSIYNNLKQISAILDQSELAITTGATIPTAVVTVADFLANPEAYESRHIKVEDVTSVKDFGGTKNGTIKSGDKELALYANNNSKGFVMPEGRNYDITGWGGVYGTTLQLLVYNQEDIFQLPSALADAETKWAKDSVAILAGEAWTVDCALTTKSDAPVVYTSSNEAVATVDNAGKITVLGYGHTVITATTAETAAYYEGEDALHLFVLEGKGILGSPYTVSDAMYYCDRLTEKVWVEGTIVGYYNNSTFFPGIEGAIASNLALGTVEQNMPVQLKSGSPVREAFNLVDNATKLSTYVALFGNIETYFDVPGLKNVSGYSLDGTTGIDSVEGTETTANEAIYDLSGRRVQNPAKGLYIMNGKKVAY